MPVVTSRRYLPNSAALSELPRANKTIKSMSFWRRKSPIFTSFSRSAAIVRSSTTGCSAISSSINDILFVQDHDGRLASYDIFTCLFRAHRTQGHNRFIFAYRRYGPQNRYSVADINRCDKFHRLREVDDPPLGKLVTKQGRDKSSSEHPMSDTAAEPRIPRVFLVEMKRIEIAGKFCKSAHHRVRDLAGRGISITD